MKKFLIAFCMPSAGLDEWMKVPEEERKSVEAAMKSEWDTWAAANAAMIKETGGLGKTKKTTSAGVTDARNDLMMYSIVEADSAEAAAKITENHPHLKIPGAWIEVMEMNQLPGMQS